MGGIIRRSRKDKSEHRVNQEWHNFILKTYREGNRGSRRLSRAQVAVLVAARAQELGICDYPSRATVYRILQSEIDKQAQKQRKRSLGWSGEKLTLKTREVSVPEAVIENSEDTDSQTVVVVPEVEVHDYEEWQQGYWL